MEFIFLFSALSVTFAFPSNKRYDRDQVLRVYPQDEEQVNILKNVAKITQIDFWRPTSAHHIVAQRSVDFGVSADQSGSVRDLLEQNGLQYKILFHDLQDEIEKQFVSKRHPAQNNHNYTRYNDWETIVAWTKDISEKNPKLVSRIEIGTTTEERPIYLLKVGKQKSVKKAIVMDCGIHAREWISPAFCQWFVKEAIRGYGKNKMMTKLLKSLTFYIIPVLNPDGYAWTWTKDRLWRKNRSNNPNSNCTGTDLNRNFAVGWGEEPYANDSCSPIYCGSAPESEKEVKAVTDFIRYNVHSIKGYISFHAYSQLLMYPYAYTYDPVPNNDVLNKIAKGAVDALTTLYDTKYIYGPIASTIYTVGGSSVDWIYEKCAKYSFVFELRDDGFFGFLLPEIEIKPTCKETMLAVKYIASYVLKHAT